MLVQKSLVILAKVGMNSCSQKALVLLHPALLVLCDGSFPWTHDGHLHWICIS